MKILQEMYMWTRKNSIKFCKYLIKLCKYLIELD